MIRNLEIRWLRAFVSVADLGSMTEAAGCLHLTQGAVSQQIRKLEEQLGTPLFKRDRRSLVLTGTGKRLIAKAREVIALNDAIRREALPEKNRGRVSIGVPYDLITCAPVQHALSAFGRDVPSIDLDLRCAPTSILQEFVKSGRLDVALLEEPAQDPSGEVLYTDALDWVASPHSTALARRPLPVSLIGEACIFRSLVQSALDLAGTGWKSVYETGSRDVTIAAIKMDMAVGAMLRSTRPDTLVPVEANSELPALPTFAVTLARRPHAPPAAGPLVEVLRHHLGGRS